MNATTSRQACPVCDFELGPDAGRCPNCQTDLRLFASTSALANEFYDDGLDLARAGDRQGAIDKLHGAIAADPGNVDAYIVLGKLLAQSGQPADLEQAIPYWERARGLRPSGEQARKLDQCIETADSKLRAARRRAAMGRRNAIGSLIIGTTAVAALCGVAGYMLRPASAHGARMDPGTAVIIPASQPAVRAADPEAAVRAALNRPDITVTQSGQGVSLQGAVHSEAERKVVVAAAAYAAHIPAADVDGSGLVIKPTVSPVGAKRVEHMLQLFVSNLGENSPDPLRSASISVAGGQNSDPLRITGTCANPKARAEIARIVKEVYPSANPVDVSGLVVRLRPLVVLPPRSSTPINPSAAAPLRAVPTARLTARQVQAHRTAISRTVPRTTVQRRAQNPTQAADGSHETMAGRQGDQGNLDVSGQTYTVQRGDSIYAITRRYGRGTQWHALWEANRQKIRNPNAIPAGTVLKLPVGWESARSGSDENP